LNKQELISLIEQPEQLGKLQITALKQVAADFPYFQAAQILLTKALYNDHHYEFERQLKHTSLLVPDRTVLFRYIHDLSDQQQPAKIVVPEIVQAAEAEAAVINLSVSPIETVIAPLVIDEPSVIQAPQNDTMPEVTAEIPEAENERVAVEEPSDITETVAVKQITSASDSVTVDLTEDKEVQEIKSSESHSFTEWLQLQQGKKMVVVETPAELTPEPQEEVSAEPVVQVKEIDTSDKTAMETEIAEQVKRSNVNDFESILDKFIRENPRISRGKAEFYNPVNMAKQSVEDNDELVTETLANVYYKQGHYKKAIRAYEKLCLIYPHKMTYFASLIQKIKTETKE
jgi:tetratricopeptide (TPR) repeat protein